MVRGLKRGDSRFSSRGDAFVFKNQKAKTHKPWRKRLGGSGEAESEEVTQGESTAWESASHLNPGGRGTSRPSREGGQARTKNGTRGGVSACRMG